MAETIESFVAKLHSDGVQAGRKEAEKITAEAARQAKTIVEQAKAQAAKIIADARGEAAAATGRANIEMRLAARDTILKLRDALSGAVRDVLARAVEPKLDSAEFIGGILHELVLEYAKADSQGKTRFDVNVRPEMRHKLADWALSEIGRVRSGHGPSIDLMGTLKRAGFEYTADGSTVEVTSDSVVAALMEMVGPHLREIISRAAGTEG